MELVCGLARENGFPSVFIELCSQPIWILGVNTAICACASVIVGVCCHFLLPYRNRSTLLIRASLGGFAFAFTLYGSVISDVSTGLNAVGYNGLAASIESLPLLGVYACLLGVSVLADFIAGILALCAG